MDTMVAMAEKDIMKGRISQDELKELEPMNSLGLVEKREQVD